MWARTFSPAISPRLNQTLTPFNPTTSLAFPLLPLRTTSLPPSNQLATDLKSGKLSAAQQDYATVQEDLQSSAVSRYPHLDHHSGGLASSSTSQNSLEQPFSQLGQDLQSGNLSQAQSPYASPQQEFAQLGAAVTTSTAPSSNALNVTA
jgi:hypothetical protein